MDIEHPLISIYLHSKTLIVDSNKNKLIFPRVTNLKDAAFVLVDWFCAARQLNALVILPYTAVIIYSSLSQELRKCFSEYVCFTKQCSFNRHLTRTADFYPFKTPQVQIIPCTYMQSAAGTSRCKDYVQ